jgi:hypothetical protein
MIEAIIWLLVATIITVIMLIAYRNKLRHYKETLGLPRGFFRILTLFTFISLYIYATLENIDEYIITSLDRLLIIIVTFYFSNHLINTIKNGKE